jgi:hypothetical protein
MGSTLYNVAVRNKEVGLKTAAKLHNVPRSTLQRYVNNTSLNSKEAVATALGRKTISSRDNDDSYCIDMDVRYFRLSAADVRHLAYQFSVRNGLPHPFSNGKLRRNQVAKRFPSKGTHVFL